jgi:uncharacterized protein
MEKFLNSMLSIFLEMSPYLLLGFFIAGILNELFKGTALKKYIGGSDMKSVVNSSLLGVPLPLCSCGVIPTGVSLHKSGASKGSAISFMISTPQTGVDSILVTYSLLGLPFAILRPFIAFVTGVFGGMVTNRLTKDEKNEKKDEGSSRQEKNRTLKQWSKDAMKYAFVDFLDDIALWLFIGLILAAAISALIPDDFFTMYVGNKYLSMLIVLAVSVPLYVCATSSVPIAAALMMKGLNPGAALVFLMAGPATNAATVTVIGRTLGIKALTGYLASIIGGALFFGILIDNFLPAQWFMPVMNEHSHHHMEESVSWIYIISAVILAILLLMSLSRYLLKKLKGAPAACTQGDCCCKEKEKGQVVIRVEGMTCHHCAANVKNGVIEVPGVTAVTVDHVSGIVEIEGADIDLDAVRKAVISRGYKVKD